MIRTPDQRLRVFVSSTLGELAPERAAVKSAIEGLRLAPVMFELGARPHPPRALYRAYVEQSHIFIGIYWESYGWVAAEMGVSGIEDEYELAAGKPCLVYVKDPAPRREQRLDEFLGRMRDDDRVSYKHFDSTAELAELVADDVAVLLTEHFEARSEARDREPRSALPARALPVPLTPFVGRERELAQLCALVAREDVRLLTLSGVGGIGKTRLALAAAAEVGGDFRDGVAFVDLSSVRSAELVPGAVAAAIGVSQEGTRPVAESLRERLEAAQALLVLDSFEQVIAAAPFVCELLASCPGLKLMITSRALLRVRGEHEFAVMPLQTPSVAAAADAIGSPAVQLFVDRALESKPGFALDETNAEAVAELCRRLEGVPLAIELAAARTRVLPVGALLGRISERLDLLTGPADLPERQRTLRATLDWSYELLDQRQRTIFAELSVFVAGFTLDSAEAVCGHDEGADVLEEVSSLIEKSLVAPLDAPDAEPRFRMLDTVREYAYGRLEESGAADATNRRMAHHFARFAARAGAALVTSENRVWLQRIDPEVNNIRAAASWAFAQSEFDLAQEVLVPPWIYWWTRGYLAELRPVAEQTLALDPPLEPVNRARLLFAAAGCRFMTGDVEAAIPLIEELIDIQAARGDDHELAVARTLYCASDPPAAAAEARGRLAEAAATLRRLGDRWAASFALATLGQIALRDGNVTEADRIQHEALEHAQAVESEQMVGIALNQLGAVALARGDVELARSRFAESARLHRHVRDREGLAYCLDGLAAVALAEQGPQLAARAIGVADELRRKIGVAVWPIMRSLRDPMVSAVEEALGAQAFEVARADGSRADPDRAIEEVLGPAYVGARVRRP